MSLRARELVIRIGRATLLGGVSAGVSPGELTAVLGPNGAGKSTLLGALSGDLRPTSGAVELDGRPLDDWSALEQARARAVLRQHSELGFPFSALEVVRMGRHPHAGVLSADEDRRIVRESLQQVDAWALRHRRYTTLSGGEQQRVHAARTLAQLAGGGRYWLLDEPTASLDPAHQHATLRLARRVAGEGVGVMVVLHDLNLAARYADRVILMRGGRVLAEGPPAESLTPETVSLAYGLEVRVFHPPELERPLLVAADPGESHGAA